MALAGRSCRTRDDRETIAFGESLARAEATVADDGRAARVPLLGQPLPTGAATSSTARAAGPESAALRPALAVFMPDRLALVKGPPAGRRTHLDGFCAALWPARARDPAPLLARARAAQRAARPDPRRRGVGRRRSTPGTSSSPSAGRRADRRSRARRSSGSRRRSPTAARGARPRRRADAALPAAQRGGRRRSSSPPSSPSAARPTSPAATPAGARTTTSSRSRPAAARCAATARRASSEPRCWRCCSPSAGRCSTTAARRR